MLANIYNKLFVMSVISGGLYLILKLFGRATQKYFGAKWHYYSYVFLSTFYFYIIPYYTLLYGVDLHFLPRPEKGLALLPSAMGSDILPSVSSVFGKVAASPGGSHIIYTYLEKLPYFLLTGTLLYALIIFIQNIQLSQRIFKTCRLARDKPVLDTLSNCKEEMGISQKIPVYISPCVSTPFLSGILKPRIVLPDIPFHSEELRCMFFHELTHWKHHDAWIKCLMVLINSIHWFNPFIYMAKRDIDRFCELSCDESVVISMNNEERKQYGELILSVLWNIADRNVKLSSAFSDKRKHLERRLNIIMGKESSKSKKWVRVLAVAMTLTLALAGTVTAYAASESYVPGSPEAVELVKADNGNIKREQPSENDNVSFDNEQDSERRSKSSGELEVIEEATQEFEIMATFSIEHSSLAPDHYTKSDSSYYIDSGEELEFSAIWTPSGQSIQIGLINGSDSSKQYWSRSYSNGNASGTVRTSDIPSGNYYVAIGTPNTNTKDVNVIGYFEWQ